VQRSALFLFALAAACGARPGGGGAAPLAKESPEVDVAAASAPHASRASKCPDFAAPPQAPLTLAEARCYMVALMNKDRASQGLARVELDDGAPSAAGQRHAEDMAKNGFLGHWGTDGSVPEQRATEAGGSDMVLENASCFVDEKRRTLDKNARIDPRHVEKAESMFFNESPPHDGHRKNILKPQHTHVGIGIAQPVATATEIPVPCFAQELVDAYGAYANVPKRMKVGAQLHVEGRLESPATIAGVGLSRVDAPQSIAVTDANKRRSYPVPPPYQMYWPAGFKTPIPLAVKGRAFSIDLPIDDGGRAGLYEISIWAKLPVTSELVIVGLRTIRVE
jgi:uncharacterized protein YkwD